MSPADDPKVEPAQVRQAQEWKHTSPLISCRIDPTGRFAFAGAQDNTVQRWDLATGQKAVVAEHKSWVRALAFSPEGKALFTGGYDGKVTLWATEATKPTPLMTLDAHAGWVRALAVSPDCKLLATCGNDNLVKLWPLERGNSVVELRGHTSHVYNVAFHPRGQFLVSADLKGVVKQWDVAKGTWVRDLDAAVLHRYDTTFLADIGGARGMAFSPDGELLACAGISDVSNAFAGVGKPVVVLFDWQSGKRKQLLRPKEEFNGTMWGVAFHPAGFAIGAAGGNGGALWFWKPDQALAFHALKLPNNARDLALHPGGNRLVVPFYDNALRVYDLTARPTS
jgi:WD40 repeat protein